MEEYQCKQDVLLLNQDVSIYIPVTANIQKRLWYYNKAEDTDAARELNTYMWKLYEQKKFKPLNILVVGAGGSYPAAVFAKHSIHDEMRTPNVEALTPQAAIRMLTQFDHIINCDWKPKYDLVIGISYSGTTSDIVSVFELCNKKGYPFLLVTGAKEIDVRALYMSAKIIAYIF